MADELLHAQQDAATGIYQVLEPLCASDFQALMADIERNGVLVPVEYDEHGHVLDGHNRVAICKLLGITDWPRFVRKGLSEEEKRGFARSINLARRHLTTAQKQKVIEAQLRDAPESSNRAIAASLGVDHKTVAGARTRLEVRGEIPQLERSIGKDGRERRKPISTMFLPERANIDEMKRAVKFVDSQDHIAKVASYLGALQSIAPSADVTSAANDVAPIRANFRAAVGTDSASKVDRGANLYETPPETVFTLLALETFSARILEPACGRGAIARVLERFHYSVVLSDLLDYGTLDAQGRPQAVQDFMASQPPEFGSYDIVTNPPYGGIMNAFIAHALRVYRPRKMALLLNWNAYSGFADEDRNFALDACPPARIYQFKRRLPMMHRDGWDGNIATSRMNTAWFVWEQQDDGAYGDQTIVRRVDWQEHMPSDDIVSFPADVGA